MSFSENWIENALRKRLELYRKKYPKFDLERVVKTVSEWEPKRQRWSPYMEDKDIKHLNKQHHRSQSLSSLSENEHL